MGIVLTDYVIESVIREGLADLKNHPERIDDLMSQMLEDYLKTDYGVKVLNELKSFLTENKIYVVQSYALAGAKLPCYSINLDTLNESDKEAGMQDYAGFEESEIAPTVLAGPFTATSFNSSTSTILVPDPVDLTNVRVNNFFVDSTNRSYIITGGVITTSGNKKFTINTSLQGEPDISGDVKVISQIGSEIVEYESIPFRERVIIGVYAQNDPNITKYLYYILMYFLHRRKKDLEARGIQLSSITASDFSREDMTPENVFSRYVSFNCLTNFKMQAETVKVLGSAGLDVRVPLDTVATDDPTRTINTET